MTEHDWQVMPGWLPACRVCGRRDTGDGPRECLGPMDRWLTPEPAAPEPKDGQR